MKVEQFVENTGDTEVTAPAADAQHRLRPADRDDWAAYMAEPLETMWRAIRCETEGLMLLDAATYADWEDFCWLHTRPRPQTALSRWMLRMDSMGS